MSATTARSTVTFSSAFRLSGLGERQPAGEYLVEHCWEPVEGLTRQGFRRTGSFLHIPAIGTASLIRQAVPIDPAELTAALEKDHSP